MAAPSETLELVRRFQEHQGVYTSGSYSEAKLRSDFLDSFFVALGWDVHNTRGYAEAYREVIPEDSIKVGAFTKAPDYCFRIGGTRKFFVEAKKPSVNVKDDLAPAFQVRRYAWSAKLPLSILTDFEEFAVYDCRVKPDKNDKASTARIMYLKYTEFETRWDEIASVFSKDAVLKGSFDKYAQAVKGKKGTTEVDAAFLHEIEGWRELFARNIALRNSNLSQRELNFAVQQTIDRIIFLRICEDRGMEAEGRLAATTNGANVYKRLCDLFRLADDKYNSGLFHFSKETGRDLPDGLTLSLEIDDKPLKDIIKGLYYPDCPYEFSVISSDILGQVYEQFLGKVIRLTDGHRAVVEDKPEVKKAGGVYYTPTYIVDYIVKNTVGKLLGDRDRGSGIGDRGTKKGETDDKDVSGFGSLAEGDGPGGGNLSTNEAFPESGNVFPHQSDTAGSYIHSGKHSRRAWKVASSGLSQVSFDSAGLAHGNGNPSADSDEVGLPKSGSATKGMGFKSVSGAYAEQANSGIKKKSLTPDTRPLTPREASQLRILDPACGSGSFLIGAYQYLLDWHLQSYVESNPQKYATGKKPELYQSHSGDWKLTLGERKRILLDNIYGVDIDPQAVEVTKLSLLLKVLEGESEQTVSGKQKLLHTRVLPDLDRNIKCGNSLIGPDFYAGQQLGFFNDEERLRINVFDWKSEFPDIMKSGGFDAVIGNPPYGIPLTKQETDYVLKKYDATRKFPDSYCLFIIQSLTLVRQKGITSMIVPNTFCDLENCNDFRSWLLNGVFFEEIWQTGWAFKSAIVDTIVFRFLKTNVPKDYKIQIRIDDKFHSRRVGDFFANTLLKIDYRNTSEKKGLLARASNKSILCGLMATIKAGVKMYERGKGIPPQTETTLKERPYSINNKCPNGWKPLYRGGDVFRYQLSKVNEFVNYGPWIAAPRSPELFISPKILMRRTDDRLLASIEQESAICVNSCHVIKLNKPYDSLYSHNYLLGLLNSKLLQHIFELQNPQMVGKVFAEIKVIYVEQLPIRTIDFSDRADKARHDRMVEMVEQMLALNKQLAITNTAHEKTALQRQIDATDHQIDQLVYDLYGLTDEEIKIVEGGS